MKKIKLQMQMSLDGFVAGPEGQLDWLSWTWTRDHALNECLNQLTDSIDTILLGRKMSEGFIGHWEAASANENDPSQPFADKMVNAQKIIFSRSITEIKGKNVRVAKNELVTEINALKATSGKDIIAYGGAEFVASLIEEDLIDEYYLFMNPTALGKGLKIFHTNKQLKLADSAAYECGIVLHTYIRA